MVKSLFPSKLPSSSSSIPETKKYQPNSRRIKINKSQTCFVSCTYKYNQIKLRCSALLKLHKGLIWDMLNPAVRNKYRSAICARQETADKDHVIFLMYCIN